MEVKLKENERIDDLQCKGLKIIQNEKGFCFGIDSVLLSEYAKEIKKDSIIVDIGTGTGIIGILLCGKAEPKKVYGIEVQEDVADMANRSIKLNDLEDKFKVINADIKNVIKDNIIEKNTVDVITINPPYKEKNTGVINEADSKIISRHETTATLSDFIEISSKLLKDRGSIYIVHKTERLVDIISKMREYKLEPKRIRFIHPKEGADANLVLIKGIKGANKFLKIDKPLYVYEQNGNYSKEILEVYGK